MKINIPEYIEGQLSGQYSGNLEDQLITKNKLSLPVKARKYSISLYKDFHIDAATIISEDLYKAAKDQEQWWKIEHTADAAIEFLQPFFEHYTFLRHKPIEIYVEQPSISCIDKKNQRNNTFGILKGRIRAKLVEPPKPILKQPEKPIVPVIPNPPDNPSTQPLPPTISQINGNGCFSRNHSWNNIFGLKDGATGVGGIYGLTGGPLGSKACFGNYGNPKGCFKGASVGGCFPNMNLGCLLPLLLMLLLLFALFKSCNSIKTLDPVVNTIKKDRDDSRKKPPVWVRDSDDTTAMEPDYTPLIADSIKIADSIRDTKDTLLLFKDTIPADLKKGQIQLEVWDWDIEDKDTVSLFLNNKLLVENLRLKKKPYRIKEKGLIFGENYLEIRANNKQRGSNTAAVRGFSDRSKLCDTALTQKSNQSSRLTLIYQ